MAYRLTRDASVAEEIKRIAREQIDKALAEVDNPELDVHATIHQVRKRCKKIRGLLRLVRPAIGKTYRRENRAYRDAAAALSGLRDAQSIISAYDQVCSHFEDQLDAEAFASIRERLIEQRDRAVADEAASTRKLADFKERIEAGRERVEAWSLRDSGFAAVAGGLRKTYGRACKAMAKAYDDGTNENFHDWRKRVKYHWYHMRLLRSVWAPALKARRREAKRLSDLLGDDHDLGVLRGTLLGDPETFGDTRSVIAVVGLLDRRRAALRAEAEPLGRRLFAENGKRFGKRLDEYWSAWKGEPEEARAE